MRNVHIAAAEVVDGASEESKGASVARRLAMMPWLWTKVAALQPMKVIHYS
jgi:hypothetical protein